MERLYRTTKIKRDIKMSSRQEKSFDEEYTDEDIIRQLKIWNNKSISKTDTIKDYETMLKNILKQRKLKEILE